MKMSQIWAMTGGFFFVFIVITLTNRPHVVPHGATGAGGRETSDRAHGPDDAGGTTRGDNSAPTLLAPAFIRGVTYVCTGVSSLADAGSDRAIAAMGSAGATWVAINLVFYQADGVANDVESDALQSPTAASLAHAIDAAHQQHLRVMLRPIVIAHDGTVRSEFQPSDPAAWLKSYRDVLSPYLEVARSHQAELISIGSGYSHLEASAPWSELIRDARRGFAGSVTYGAAYAGASYQNVPFWSALDYIGVETFAAAATPASHSDPSSDWNHVIRDVQGWAKTGAQGKPVIFTSVGMPVEVATADRRGNGAPAAPDAAQAASCAAFYQALAGQTWVAGAFWYGWEYRGADASGNPNPFAVQDDATLASLKMAYAGHP